MRIPILRPIFITIKACYFKLIKIKSKLKAAMAFIMLLENYENKTRRTKGINSLTDNTRRCLLFNTTLATNKTLTG